MQNMLALGLLAIFYLAIAKRAHKCVVCPRVHFSNRCEELQRRCTAQQSRNVFCYTRLVIQDQVIQHMEKGCTTECDHITKHGERMNVTWCCKRKTLCNYDNRWTQI